MVETKKDRSGDYVSLFGHNFPDASGKDVRVEPGESVAGMSEAAVKQELKDGKIGTKKQFAELQKGGEN